MVKSTGSIIIPAYNEQDNISKTLESLNIDSLHGIQVIVVCNGCTDETATLVKRNYPSVKCLETDQASKALAIRHAESTSPPLPRLYMDADVLLSGKGAKHLLALAASAARPQVLVPVSRLVSNECTSVVRRYYAVWMTSPFVIKEGYGCGIYTLNQSARATFGEWPDVFSDDGFVRTLAPVEIDHSSTSVVKAPKTLDDLLNIKARSKFSAAQLSQQLQDEHTVSKRGPLRHVWLMTAFLRNPLNAMVYILVNILAASRARDLLSRGDKIAWLRDESTR